MVEKVVSKQELVKRVSEKSKFPRSTVAMCLNVFMDVIKEALSREERVELRGFGTFLMKHRAARVARNPRTGESIKIPEKLVPSFKPGRDLKKVEKIIKKGRKK